MTDREKPGRRLLGALVFAVWCVLAVEFLLWVASLVSPRVEMLLTNQQAVPRSAEIVTLGDSQTVGMNARREDSWPKQLQRMLSTSVYNMSIAGTGPIRYHYLLDQALELDPLWVVTGFYVGNDLWDSVHEYYLLNVPGMDWRPKDPARVREVEERAEIAQREYVEAARYLTYQSPFGPKKGGARKERKEREERDRNSESPVRVLQDHSRIWGAARAIKAGIVQRRLGEAFDRRHWNQLVEAARSDSGLMVYESAGVKTILHPGHRFHGEDLERDSLLQEGLDLSLHTLQRIDAEVKAAGSRHLVLLIPSKEYVYHEALDPPPPAGTVMEALARNEAEIWDRTKAFLDANRIEYVDALPEMRRGVAEDVQLYPYSTQSHPDAPGYERIASAVARALEERGFAAGRP